MLDRLEQPVVVLAPMSGVSDFPFRSIVSKYSNPSLLVSEMIASTAMIRQVKKTLKRGCQGKERVVIQLAGNDPETMAEAARLSQDMGAMSIDINMGCPVKKIAINSYAGAALMRDEILVAKIFQAIVRAVSIPVSVKMRKGWDHTCQNALALARLAKDSGLSFMTLHARTRNQMFNGKADWEFIKELQASIDFPVIGNGDIITEHDAASVSQYASGIMIGRGAYGRPWILGHVRHFLKTGTILPPPRSTILKEMVLEHFDAMMTYYGTQQGIPLARKHLMWYSKGIVGASDFRASICRETEVSKILEALEVLFQDSSAQLSSEDGIATVKPTQHEMTPIAFA